MMINETAARQAHEMNSYREYKSGSATAEYKEMVTHARELAEKRKAATDESFHEQIDNLLGQYEDKLSRWYNKKFRIESMCPSIMVTGSANFPVRKKERQNRARDNHYNDYKEIEVILQRIQAVGTSISSDNPKAIELLKKKLEQFEARQENMKLANAHWRKYGTMAGFAKFTDAEAIAVDTKIKNGYHGQPCPAWELSNNSANIRRIRERIESMENAPEFEGWEFDGGCVEVNKDANRIQIIYNNKPEEEVRTVLKSHGFKWSWKYGTWQRMLNTSGVYAAKKVTGKV
jgi:frataxin-like iron-binding protein CyaY